VVAELFVGIVEKGRRLRWLGLVSRMEDFRTAHQTTQSELKLEEKAAMAKEKLDGHHQTKNEGYGHYLGRCPTTGDRQSRASNLAIWGHFISQNFQTRRNKSHILGI